MWGLLLLVAQLDLGVVWPYRTACWGFTHRLLGGGSSCTLGQDAATLAGSFARPSALALLSVTLLSSGMRACSLAQFIQTFVELHAYPCYIISMPLLCWLDFVKLKS